MGLPGGGPFFAGDADAQSSADETDQRGSSPDDHAQNDSLTESEATGAGCGLVDGWSGWGCADFAHVAIVMCGSTGLKPWSLAGIYRSAEALRHPKSES